MNVVGVDIGGSGIKGAPVDLVAGKFAAERTKLPTPRPATPDGVMATVASVVADVVAREAVDAPVGVAFPGVVRSGRTLTAANLDDGWADLDFEQRLGEQLGRPVVVCNDADAAGIAEMHFGAGRGCAGVVVVITLGTGIGSAVFTRGVLVPNTEFGHLPLFGDSAEKWASANVRKAEGLSWDEWGDRVDHYLGVLDVLFNPDRIVLGGGVSRRADRWIDRVTSPRAEVVPAELENDAGIVGVALLASGRVDRP